MCDIASIDDAQAIGDPDSSKLDGVGRPLGYDPTTLFHLD
jgi:hypothetical protein